MQHITSVGYPFSAMNKPTILPARRIMNVITMFCLLFVLNSLKAKNFVIINKIMYDTPLNEQIATGVAYSNGEYVELYNAGIETVSLNGWVLRGGGSTEIYYFPSNTTMVPKSYLIVAYQYNNSGFTLDLLYTGLTPTPDHQIQYQRKILWSNSGEPVYLRDNTGLTKDSIYYDGTSAKTKPNRLSADNADGISGNVCVCLQRKTALFAANGCAIPNNLEWATTLINPFQQHSTFIQPFLPGVGIGFVYDDTGNRISRKQITLSNTMFQAKKNFDNAPQEVGPEVVEEKLGNRIITVYPNPTKGSLVVGISGEILDKISIILYNSQGIMLKNILADTDINPIEMINYPLGWYIIRVINDGKSTEFKIIKK